MSVSELGMMIDYFHSASDELLEKMGVDRTKLPDKETWLSLLTQDQTIEIADRESYFQTVLKDKRPIGHTNVNKVSFGSHATLHLHIWDEELRKTGIMDKVMPEAVEIFGRLFRLEKLICEPKADNHGPNRLLEKLGFRLQGSRHCTPGWINFPQKVNTWEYKY